MEDTFVVRLLALYAIVCLCISGKRRLPFFLYFFECISIRTHSYPGFFFESSCSGEESIIFSPFESEIENV